MQVQEIGVFKEVLRGKAFDSVVFISSTDSRLPHTVPCPLDLAVFPSRSNVWQEVQMRKVSQLCWIAGAHRQATQNERHFRSSICHACRRGGLERRRPRATPSRCCATPWHGAPSFAYDPPAWNVNAADDSPKSSNWPCASSFVHGFSDDGAWLRGILAYVAARHSWIHVSP